MQGISTKKLLVNNNIIRELITVSMIVIIARNLIWSVIRKDLSTCIRSDNNRYI